VSGSVAVGGVAGSGVTLTGGVAGSEVAGSVAGCGCVVAGGVQVGGGQVHRARLKPRSSLEQRQVFAPSRNVIIIEIELIDSLTMHLHVMPGDGSPIGLVSGEPSGEEGEEGLPRAARVEDHSEGHANARSRGDDCDQGGGEPSSEHGLERHPCGG